MTKAKGWDLGAVSTLIFPWVASATEFISLGIGIITNLLIALTSDVLGLNKNSYLNHHLFCERRLEPFNHGVSNCCYQRMKNKKGTNGEESKRETLEGAGQTQINFPSKIPSVNIFLGGKKEIQIKLFKMHLFRPNTLNILSASRGPARWAKRKYFSCRFHKRNIERRRADRAKRRSVYWFRDHSINKPNDKTHFVSKLEKLGNGVICWTTVTGCVTFCEASTIDFPNCK